MDRRTLRVFLTFCVVFIRLLDFVRGMSIVGKIETETAPAGGVARMKCHVLSRTRTQVVWQKLKKTGSPTVYSVDTRLNVRNRKLANGENKYDIYMRPAETKGNIFELVIRALSGADGGTYRCMLMIDGVADNPFQDGELIVQLPPDMKDSKITRLVEVVEGDTARLFCDASGMPTPTISWSRANGKELPNGEQTYYGKLLEIKKVNRSSGGVYRCKADNNVKPFDTIDVSLRVRTKPQVWPFRRHYGQAPDRNYEVEMTCMISGDPIPDLRWYFNDGGYFRPLHDDYKHVVERIGMYPGHGWKQDDIWFSMRILQLTTADFGQYICSAENMYGRGNASIKLYRTTTCQGALCTYESSNRNSSPDVRTSITAMAIFTVISLSL